MNVFYPFNLEAFLNLFSQDIIGMIFNPFKYIDPNPSCTSPRAFAARGLECKILASTGQIYVLFSLALLLATIPRTFKDKITGATSISKIFTASWLAAVLDGMYFNACLGAILNLYTYDGDSNAWSLINMMLSILTLLGLLCYTGLATYYCWCSPHMPHRKKRTENSQDSLSSNTPSAKGLSYCRQSTISKAETMQSQMLFAKGSTSRRPSAHPKSEDPTIPAPRQRGLKNWYLNLDIGYFYSERPNHQWTGILNIPMEQIQLLMTCACLVLLHDYPFWQIFSCAMIKLIQTGLVLYKPMHVKPADNAKKNKAYVLLAISLAIILSLTKEGNGVFTPKGQYNVVGFGEIIILSILLSIALISSLIELYELLRSGYRYIRKKYKIKSVIHSVGFKKIKVQDAPASDRGSMSSLVHITKPILH